MRFRRWVVFTFAIHVLVILIDKGAGFVLLKMFEDNPEVKGALDLLSNLPFIMMAVANLGLATSLLYYLRKGLFGLKAVSETTSMVALVWGTIVAGVMILLSQTVLPLLQPNWNYDLAYVVPICLCVPLLLTASYFNSIQMAVDRVRDYNFVHLFSSAVFLPLFLLFYFVIGDPVEGIAMGRFVSAALVTLLTLWMLRAIVRWRPRMHWGFFRQGVSYGWKANLTSVLTYLNHRIDLYLVSILFLAGGALGDDLKKEQLAEAAFYGTAVSFAELVWHFPEAMRDLFFSKVAGSTHAQARYFTPILCRLSLWTAAVGSVAIYFLVDPAMSLLMPDSWQELWSDTVTGALVVLIPGTVGYTIAKILQNDLAARGHINQCMVASSLVLVVMLSLDVWLIPEHGAVGAAIASTVAYLASSVYTLFAYRACGGGGFFECLVIHRQDAEYVRELFAAVREKVRGWRS